MSNVTFTQGGDHPKGISHAGGVSTSSDIFGYYTREYREANENRLNGGKWKWVNFEEFPEYEIRPASDCVVEVRKAGSKLLVKQYCPDFNYERGWWCYLFVDGVRAKVNLWNYWKKYGNRSSILSHKIFCRIGIESGIRESDNVERKRRNDASI